MQINYCQNVITVRDIINHIIENQFWSKIQELTTLRKLPHYLHGQIWNQTTSILNQYQPKRPHSDHIHYQCEDSIMKCQPDNIIPLHVKREKHMNPEGLKHSILGTKTSLRSPRSILLQNTKTIEKFKLKKQFNLVSVPDNKQIDDRQDEMLRLMKLKQRQQAERIKREQLQIQAKLNKSRQAMSHQEGHYTFDGYDIIKSELIDAEPFNVKSIKMSIHNDQESRTIDLASIASFIESKVQRTRNNSKSILQESINLVEFVEKQIPSLRQTKPRIVGPTLQSYRKNHGGIFKRLREQSSQRQSIPSNQQIEELDLKNLSIAHSIKSERSSYTRKYIPEVNKIILPKLNGRYSILDRYKSYTNRQTESVTIQ